MKERLRWEMKFSQNFKGALGNCWRTIYVWEERRTAEERKERLGRRGSGEEGCRGGQPRGVRLERG